MRKIALIAAIAVLALAVSAGWQIASCELADRQLEEALRDIASRNAEHIGLSAPTTDDDLRNSVIRAAKELGIVLDPRHALHHRDCFFENPRTGLGGERVLGFEVIVEAAMGEAGGMHQVGDADRLEALLAEQARRGRDPPRLVLRHLLPRKSHACRAWSSC